MPGIALPSASNAAIVRSVDRLSVFSSRLSAIKSGKSESAGTDLKISAFFVYKGDEKKRISLRKFKDMSIIDTRDQSLVCGVESSIVPVPLEISSVR